MKRVGFLMERIGGVDNLLEAYAEARKGKGGRDEVVNYGKDLLTNILRLREQLLSDTVTVGRYRYFNIYDPKLRKICAAVFEERILHHAVVRVCHPYFERNLIYDTYASRCGKGVYAAIDRARTGMRRYAYVAKLDVRKFFDSIPHELLKVKLKRLFKDPRLLALFDRIIDSYEVSAGRGLPIGNLTSQYFANYYMSFLDHYIKEELRVPMYVRYMDDMLLFGATAAEVGAYVRAVRRFAEERLELTLKEPVFGATARGISFLGYTLYPHKILLNRRSKVRFKKKWRRYDRLYAEGVWREDESRRHILSVLAFAGKAYTKRLRMCLCRENSWRSSMGPTA